MREFYRVTYGIELESFYNEPPRDRLRQSVLISSAKDKFSRVEGDPQFGDILLIKIMGIECHIAVYLGEGKILHTQEKTGCIIDRYKKWEKIVTGIYRINKSD